MTVMPHAPKRAVQVNLRLSREILVRIDRVLYGGELRSMFFRRAAEAELKRRETDPAAPALYWRDHEQSED